MPDEKPAGKPHAILCPRSLIKGSDTVDRALWVNKVIGPILGVKRVHCSPVPGDKVFLRGELHAKDDQGNADHAAPYSVQFPTDHPLAGQDRYEWVETPEGSGVMYGTLKPDLILNEGPNAFGE